MTRLIPNHDSIVVPQTEDEELSHLEEALALSMSMAPLISVARAKPPPPLPPAEPRPEPPTESPPRMPLAAPQRRFINLPLLFPPSGSQWNNSVLARESRPRPPAEPVPSLYRRDILPESLGYFPSNPSGYRFDRRGVPHPFWPPTIIEEVDSDGEDNLSDATSTVSTQPSYHYPNPEM